MINVYKSRYDLLIQCITLLLIVAGLSSCMVIHSGNVSSGTLQNFNDEHVAIATGVSKSLIFFGLAGDYSNEMILDAKMNLFRNRPLREGEYYTNFTCDISRKIILGVFFETRVTVSAEVLRPHSVRDDDPHPKAKFAEFTGVAAGENLLVNGTDTFRLGRTVYHFIEKGRALSFEIVGIYNNGLNLRPKYKPVGNLFVNPNVVYSPGKIVGDFKTGDKIMIKMALGHETGVILGFCGDKALVKTHDWSYSIPAAKLKKAE
jgi:hypothetical protein